MSFFLFLTETYKLCTALHVQPWPQGDMGSPSPIGRSPPRSGEVHLGVFISEVSIDYPLVMTNIAIENGP